MKSIAALFFAGMTGVLSAQTATPVANPAGAGSSQVSLSEDAKGEPLLSWVESKDDAFSLKYSIRRGNAWSEARTIAAKRPFFHHPAELPEVIALKDGTLVAHWIEAPEGADDAEFVYVAASVDGVKWSAPVMAHKDKHAVQHGLASIVASGDSEVSILWLQALQGEDGPVSLRRTVLTIAAGTPKVLKEESIDDDVCSCCPTAVVKTARGLAVAYRDRSPYDIRDIAVTRLENGKWSEGKIVAADNWKIEACPTNAAAAEIQGDKMGVAWYTAAGNKPRVEAALSTNGGASFGKALPVSTGEAYGYASIASDEAGGAMVSWLERGASGARVLVRHVAANGTLGPAMEVAQGSRQSLGYPRLTRAGGETWIAWNTPAGGKTAILK